PAPEDGLERARLGACEIAQRAVAEPPERWRGLRADAPHALDGERRQERGDVVADEGEAVRLVAVAGDLRGELARRDAGRRGEPGLPCDGLADRACDGRAVAEELSAV